MKINKLKLARAVICLVAVTIMMFKVSGYVFGDCMKSDVKYEVVVVKEGDSLWKIAEEYNVRGDIRNKIKEIQEFNSMKSPTVYKSQVIKVPTE